MFVASDKEWLGNNLSALRCQRFQLYLESPSQIDKPCTMFISDTLKKFYALILATSFRFDNRLVFKAAQAGF